MLAERLISDYLGSHHLGATLRELCDALSGKLGAWPPSVNTELCFPFLGHLEHGLSQATIALDRSVHPVVYRRV